MTYRILNHTADLGIEVTAADRAGLYAAAAEALFDQIVDRGDLAGAHVCRLDITGSDPEDLMLAWLRELLYLWNGEAKLVQKAEVETVTQTRIAALVRWDPFSPDRHVVLAEIKAVTYHRLQVRRCPSGWKATIVLDV